ncbi:hypothetical protein TRFO_37715 [Tritrichomonas foetus]|uniref:Uncharacterized protein n=1 Tax=Tritrichomonas foetus TaxID=1144522 RepID=A0A1J4JFA7_9EUKA|nr:hypothetical protein TRFO_37715 [Tritrichomonas foetus]|eukprot:OHS96133.1 hypothetical protein TRFO_37715 [Tritrichomonas foetus]
MSIPSSPRSRKATITSTERPALLQYEMKLCRDEALALNKSNTQLEHDCGELRKQLQELKSQIKIESRKRKNFIAGKENENQTKIDELNNEFAQERNAILSNRSEFIQKAQKDIQTNFIDFQNLRDETVNMIKEQQLYIRNQASQVHKNVAFYIESNTLTNLDRLERSLEHTLTLLPSISSLDELPSKDSNEVEESFCFELPEQCETCI